VHINFCCVEELSIGINLAILIDRNKVYRVASLNKMSILSLT